MLPTLCSQTYRGLIWFTLQKSQGQFKLRFRLRFVHTGLFYDWKFTNWTVFPKFKRHRFTWNLSYTVLIQKKDRIQFIYVQILNPIEFPLISDSLGKFIFRTSEKQLLIHTSIYTRIEEKLRRNNSLRMGQINSRILFYQIQIHNLKPFLGRFWTGSLVNWQC